MMRNFGLDIMRAFSIWLVLLQHAEIDIPGLSPLKIGGIGVEIFFVLSGFLIGGILFKEIDKGNSFLQTLKSFWVRRWFRILPLYYAILLFKFIFIDDSIGWNILYYVFFLQNNIYGIQYFGVSWSLVIEEWFYLFTPVFLLLATMFFKSKEKVFLSMITFIIFVNISRVIYVYFGNIPYAGVNSNFPFRFDSLFLGVVFSFAKHNNWKVFNVTISKRLFVVGVILFVGYLLYFWSLSYQKDLINKVLFPRTIGFFVLPFTISLTIPYMSGVRLNPDKNIVNKLLYEFISITSILTYSIYLTHLFIYSLGYNFIISIILVYLISWLIYNWFEKPILKYRDKITNHKSITV
jgi:peptidoglycan/LPS O-acetylase OafA/YrhL